MVSTPHAIEARELARRFGSNLALDGLSLTVAAGEVHALLGPNGAGKTVTLRILTGLLTPDAGAVRVYGTDVSSGKRAVRALIGFVPAGDRTFYLRLSGLENLIFFARLHGFTRREARRRASAVLERVALAHKAAEPVASYSHGMQKRLSVARALLTEPAILLVDEATHDLDPEAAAGVRALVSELAVDGAAVLWTTQRLDEIRGFADRVTLLGEGRVRFNGSVHELIARAQARGFVLRVGGRSDAERARGALAAGALTALDGDHWLLTLGDGEVLGDAIAALAGAGVAVLGCHRERSEVEDAFVSLSARTAP